MEKAALLLEKLYNCREIRAFSNNNPFVEKY